MDITEVRDTLLKWTHSCETEEQVDLLEEVLSAFFERFEKVESFLNIQINKDQLRYEMKEQKLIIKRKLLYNESTTI